MSESNGGIDDFFTSYMAYCDIENSEAPAIFHRWTCASIIGASLGRNCYIKFGSHTIYPNQYIMFMGPPGARKGTGMNIGKKLLQKAGYDRFAADKSSKERFLLDMKQFDLDASEDIDLDMVAFDDPSESYIFAGEFTDFIGQNNMDFITFLTNLWDNLPIYKNPKITGKSVVINKPTINLLGANTPEGFALAFPPEALGNGFLSRVLMIFGDTTGNRVTWPAPLDELQTELLALRLKEIREKMRGEITVSKEAKDFGSRIYNKEVPVDDPRFVHYQQRRFIHVLKLAIIIATSNLSFEITEQVLKRAHTMLATAEKYMPKALGEFGASRYSVVAGKILSFLGNSRLPQSPTEIWKAVHKDLSKMSELAEILSSLKLADKIQAIQIKGKSGYMQKNIEGTTWDEDTLDKKWLTKMELFK